MELRYLRSFIAVAKHRSFTLAAHELFLTQSAVSQQIRSLEVELGRPLFLRERQAVTLTESGTRLLPQAQQIVDLADRARAAVVAAQPAAGALTIVAATVASSYLYVELYERFSRAHPDITLTIQTGVGRDEALERVRTGRADAAFVQLPLATPGFATDLLGETAFVAVARPPIGDSARLLVWDGFPDVLAALPTTPVLQTNDIALIKRFADAREGVAVLPVWAVKSELDSEALVPVSGVIPSLRQQFGIAYRPEPHPAPLAAFLERCQEARPAIAEQSSL